MKEGFQNCAAFFSDMPLTGFQKRVRSAIIAYSQGVGTHGISGRLVYAMSAAEHLLLRDENEPIQTGVGERMAFLIAIEPERRREIATNFKKAYGLRSRHVHHLASVDNEEVLSAFFMNIYSALHRAMQLMTTYKEREEFLDAIDAVKFGKG